MTASSERGTGIGSQSGDTDEAGKDASAFRQYEAHADDHVAHFYRDNHRYQTLAFVQGKVERFVTNPVATRNMSILQALDFLDTLIDESDPDLDLSQLTHLLQTAEAIRADGHEDWFVLTGFLHDLGKILCLFGEPQWAVVGDTFPVGCAFSDRIVYPAYFAANPDAHDPRYTTPCGIYEPGCGLRNVTMSWGHDEYLYHQLKPYLPEPALYLIRYHSFYAWHREGEYAVLQDDHDREMLPWVQRFNPYDLYSKSPQPPDWQELRPYYVNLIERYVPDRIDWPC